MCTVLLLPVDNPIAVNKYIVSYHTECNAQAPHGHLCPVSSYYNFPPYLIIARIFGNTSLSIKFVFFIFPTNLYVSFLIVTITEQDVINVFMSLYKVPIILVRL